MKFETIKSFFLVFLVVLSLLLTWGVWTYYPTNEYIPNNKVVQDLSIGIKKDVQDLILPEQVLYHTKGRHYLSNELADINVAYKELQKGSISDVREITDEIKKEAFLSLVHGNGKLEIIFPTKIPKRQLDILLQISERSTSENLEADRIILDFTKNATNKIKVYLVNYYERKIFEGYVEDISKQSFYQMCDAYYSKIEESIPYQTKETTTVFLPKKEVGLQEETYLISELSPEAFRNALFTDPTYVKKETTPNSDAYIDGTRMLKVFYDNQYLQYVNPAIISDQHSTSGPLIQKSIDFINDHNGWTNTYRFYSWNGFRGETVFRLYRNHYPVFSQSGTSIIQQKWGEEDIISYSRALFKMTSVIQTKTVDVKLPSGADVLSFIKQRKDLNSESIKEIFVGYELNLTSATNKYVTITPIWIMNYEGSYKKIIMPKGEKGGEIDGLESN